MMRLLTLSDERMATELRHAQEEAAVARAWHRATFRLVWRCACIYLAGTALAFSSMGFRGDVADALFWGGLTLGSGAWFAFLLAMWAREAQ